VTRSLRSANRTGARTPGSTDVTRELRVVDSRDVGAVLEALRHALSGDGAAILPHPGSPAGLPPAVPQRVALVVETSGSTGRPKRVALSSDALLASAAASSVRLGGDGQWLLALPAHYIAGVNVLVRSLAAQTEPVLMGAEPLQAAGSEAAGIEAAGFDAAGFVSASERLDGARRYTALVPAQLARLLDDARAVEALRGFDAILVGGQSLPAGVAARALELALTVVRTYGSSETSGGCVYDGVPIGNTLVAIVGGRVELAGSVLAEGYLGDDARTSASFVERDSRRWYVTDDRGALNGSVLTVTGRVDDVIISGGVKVSLAEVEAHVRSLPGLGDAAVVADHSAQWGEVPVVVSTHEVDLATLRASVSAALGPAAAPARVVVVDAIPMLSSGKPDRLRLAALVRH
jgi:O-succinylbenzoic acid--CoA ligase